MVQISTSAKEISFRLLSAVLLLKIRVCELSLQVQRQALETRQAELFINIYNRWTDPEFAKHYHAVR